MIEQVFKDVLFICGGAFDGINEVIKRRIGEKVIGFNSDISAAQAGSRAAASWRMRSGTS